jgi:GNAT superfamily N-acetyltransferase
VVHVDWITDGADERLAPAAGLLTAWERDELDQARTTPVDEVAQSVWSHPFGLRASVAVAESEGRVVGAAHLTIDAANPHTAWMRWLVVDHSFRRRGVGRALIAALQQAARAEGIGQLGHAALADSDMAAAFGSAVGARPGLVVEQNRLLIADIPSGLVPRWIERSSERAAGYSLVSWNNECPEEYLERCARAYEIMNTAPDQLDEPMAPNAERVRAGLAVHVGQGEGFHTTVLDEKSGELVALTELRHIRFRPWYAGQGDTCTHPAHRDKGLGRWIKAHNLQWLLDRHPEVEEIDTYNADGNEPMVNLNRELGFRCLRLWRHWRVTT